MARIRTLELSHQSLSPHPTEVDATYQILDSSDGTRVFQLSTYGSPNRVSVPKVSQTFQLDEEIARSLVDAIRSAFPSI
jgi:hypothetical protein